MNCKIITPDKEISFSEGVVLSHISKWSAMLAPMWYGYSTLCDDLSMNINEVKRIMKSLRAKGYVVYCTTVNGDGVPNGSGYFITDFGKLKVAALSKPEEDTA